MPPVALDASKYGRINPFQGVLHCKESRVITRLSPPLHHCFIFYIYAPDQFHLHPRPTVPMSKTDYIYDEDDYVCAQQFKALLANIWRSLDRDALVARALAVPVEI